MYLSPLSNNSPKMLCVGEADLGAAYPDDVNTV
jgi:hypothetical protein